VRDPRKCIRIFFVRCLTNEAYSMSCGSSGTGETPQTQSVEEAHRPPRGSLSSLERKSTDSTKEQQFIQNVWVFLPKENQNVIAGFLYSVHN
jgi:hypothetical protein